MEPNPSADRDRQSRGLARFWPGHAASPAPGQRDSDEDDDATLIENPPGAHQSHSGSAQAAAAARLAAQMQEDTRISARIQDDTQMVALGSRGSAFPRPWDDDNQGGFPPVDSERAHQNGEAPRHGGAPIPNGTAPMPQPRPTFGTPPSFPGASPFAPPSPQPPRPPEAPPTQHSPPAQHPQPLIPQQPAPQPPIPQAPIPQAPIPQAPIPQAPANAQPPVKTPAEAKTDEKRIETDASEVKAIPLGSTAGRRRSPDDLNELDRDKPAKDKKDEPGQNGKPTGWATVPTSGIPSLAKQATPVPAARRPAAVDDADDQPRAGRRADEEAPTSGSPLRPGDVTMSQITFWDEEAVVHFRKQWHEVKADFVDDPVAALTRAHDLLTEAVNELTEALLAERDELDPLVGKGTPDTESMRMAMRGYREFLDRILAL